jgi:hypothetical protein
LGFIEDSGDADIVEVLCSKAVSGAREDFDLVILRWVGDDQFEEEAVELRFGERIRAFEFDGVLSRKDHEREGHGKALSINRNVPLFHGFEERGLRFGGRAIHLVREQDGREDGAFSELELSEFRVKYVGAEDVAGHEVGRELNSAIGQVERFREAPHEQGLCDTGDSFEQDVAIREKGG